MLRAGGTTPSASATAAPLRRADEVQLLGDPARAFGYAVRGVRESAGGQRRGASWGKGRGGVEKK